MDMKLQPFDFAQAVARAGRRPAADAGGPQGTGAHEGFESVFAQALRDVSRTQQTVERLQHEVATDQPTANVEATMVAMQRAQIGFQMALQTRNRLVQAYSDIMNMQV